jgi:hypothetical protein
MALVSLSGKQSPQNPSLTWQVPDSLVGTISILFMEYLGVNLLVWETVYSCTQNPSLTRQVPNSWAGTVSTLFMEYLGVSLLVREAVYQESLPVPASTKLLVKAPSQPYHEVPWCESPCSGGSLSRIPPCSGKTKLLGKAPSQPYS